MKILLVFPFIFLCACTTILEAPSPLKRKGYIAVPLKHNPLGHYEVIAKINGKKAKLILDTGASGTAIHRGFEKTFNLLNIKNSSTTASGFGASNHQAKLMRAKKIQIGKWVKRNFIVTLVDFTHIIEIYKKSGEKAEMGVLGNDVLKSAQAIIDLKNNTLYLKR